MRRIWFLAAPLLVLVAPGCGDGEEEIDLLPRYERSCTTGEECPGRKCVQVGPNLQELPGVCSRACSSDIDCGPNAGCFLLGQAGGSCLSLCSERAPCEGGLACVEVGAGGERACFVEAAPGNR